MSHRPRKWCRRRGPRPSLPKAWPLRSRACPPTGAGLSAEGAAKLGYEHAMHLCGPNSQGSHGLLFQMLVVLKKFLVLCQNIHFCSCAVKIWDETGCVGLAIDVYALSINFILHCSIPFSITIGRKNCLCDDSNHSKAHHELKNGLLMWTKVDKFIDWHCLQLCIHESHAITEVSCSPIEGVVAGTNGGPKWGP